MTSKPVFWGAVVFTLAAVSVAIAEGVAPPVVADPVLSYLQAAGFPTWAAVLVWGVMQVTNEMKVFLTRLDTHIAQTNAALKNMEEMIITRSRKHHPPPVQPVDFEVSKPP